jgi:hypothetical protein
VSEQPFPPWVAAKMGAMIPVSNEMLRMFRMDHEPYTPEQQAAMDAWHAECRRLEADYDERLRAALVAVTDPMLRAIIDHHGPAVDYGDYEVCQGCDLDGYEVETPGWPCSTTVLIGERLGVAQPVKPWMPR